MYFTTVVHLSAAETRQPLAGVKVSLFDRDLFSPDDALGTETSDAKGEACFRYSSDDFADLDDKLRGEMPDLYVVVHGADGSKLFSTRSETVENTPRKRIAVALDAGVVARLDARSVA